MLAGDPTPNLKSTVNSNDSEVSSGGNKVAGSINLDTDKQCIVYTDGVSGTAEWTNISPWIAYSNINVSQTITTSDGFLTTLINDETISPVVVGDIIKVEVWAHYVESGGNVRIQMYVDDSASGSIFVGVGGTTATFQSTSIDFTRVFVATLTTHDFGIKGFTDSSVSETLVDASILITVYPQGVA